MHQSSEGAEQTHTPIRWTHVLLLDATESEVRDISQICLPQKISVIPCSLNDLLEQDRLGKTSAADLAVLKVDRLDCHGQEVESKIKQLHHLGFRVLCLLPAAPPSALQHIIHLPVDDFVMFPLRSEELICRIEGMQSREEYSSDTSRFPKRITNNHKPAISAVELNFNSGRDEIVVNQRLKCAFLNGIKLELTPKEFRILSLLVSEDGRVFSSDEIINEVWGGKKRTSASDVQQYIHLLRKKIEIDPRNPQWIRTVKGFGYLFKMPS